MDVKARLSTDEDMARFRDSYIENFRSTLADATERWQEAGGGLREWMSSWVLDGYLNRNVDVLVSWVTEDFEHRDPLNLGRVVRGPHEFRRTLVDTFVAFPDSDFALDGPPSLSLGGQTVTIPWRARGHFLGPLTWGPPGQNKPLTPNGRQFDFRGIDTYQFRGDKVCAMQSHYDPIDVATQLALIPSPEGRAVGLAAWPQAVLALLQRRR